jgi:sugar-specific transcriptional regulator TrmB
MQGDQMTDISVLQEMGLSEAEAKVYLALLDSGSTTAGLVIKKAGLHRATTYQILNRLQEKGLVSAIIKGKKQYFEATDPKRLLDALKERETRLKQALPNLEGLYMAAKEKQEVTVYSGVGGLRTVLERALDEMGKGGEYLDFGVAGLFRETMGPFWHVWQKRKVEQKIRCKVIFNEEVKVKKPEVLREYYGEARFHPKEYASLTDTFIYNDTVMLLLWTAKPPLAIVIKNSENAKSYRNQFALMWKQAKKN